jgi:hypothetical protein
VKPWHLVVAGFLVAALGCNSGVQATGNVTLDGKPLMAGSAAFEPSGELAKVAPSCTAPIINGAFQTPGNRPLKPGTYVVWIRPAAMVPGGSTASEQFEPWSTEVTVSKDGGPIVIAVPTKQ